MLATLAVAVVAMAGAAWHPPWPATGATATSLGYVSGTGEDGLRNYDFESKVVSATYVDCAISLLFVNNASINRVKTAVNARYGWGGSTEYGRLRDSARGGGGSCGAWCWDSDGGRKTSLCPIGTDEQFRVYAPAGADRLYNVVWGYYVDGSTHQDHSECGLDPTWFGNSEVAERNLVQYWSS